MNKIERKGTNTRELDRRLREWLGVEDDDRIAKMLYGMTNFFDDPEHADLFEYGVEKHADLIATHTAYAAEQRDALRERSDALWRANQ